MKKYFFGTGLHWHQCELQHCEPKQVDKIGSKQQCQQNNKPALKIYL